MIIDFDHPAVKALIAEWAGVQTVPENDQLELSRALKERLANQILALIASFGGQLILTYHEFLIMEPSGAHSFAHGSEMWSKTVYWMHVARLCAPPSIVKEHSPGSEIGRGQLKIRFAPSTTYLIPVAWQWALYPFYPDGGNQSFGFTKFGRFLPWRTRREPDEVSEPRADPLDISFLGDHLFKSRRGRHDWATKICLAVGTEAVGKWLTEHGSQAAFDQLANY